MQGGGLRSEAVDLAALVGGLLRARASEEMTRGLRVSEDLGPAVVQGDLRLVERLAANLLDNALRHNVPGGSVTVTTGTKAGAPYLCITNDGAVVQPDEIERLYGPFERLDGERTNSVEGFGLGLCIVKAVAAAHGATLDTRARPTGGLRVEARFPVLSPSGVDR